MSRWFRYYDDALNDPKVQRLSGDLFKAWINLLCLCSKNGGAIRSLSDAAFALRLSEAKAGTIVEQLARYGLLDPVQDGYFEPHNWSARQFKSDVSNERVKRHRERRCNVTETVTETTPETEADTETNTEKKVFRAVAKPTRPQRDQKFDEFKAVYPKRKGANPWKPAQALFDRAVLAGNSPDQIISAIRSGIGYDREKLGTEFIPQAVKWLRDERWKDLLASSVEAQPAYLTPPPGCQSLEEIRAAYGAKNGQVGTEARSDPGVGQDGTDKREKLSLSG